ncbi:MAG: hypothetical protein IJ157_04225 [Clostridia bacterium]|nr:hypothetical protein [Clostridia bacterium]
MPEQFYQLLALAARALFILIAALTALRAALGLMNQHRARKKLLKQLPDAGMVGEMRDIESDKSYPLPREGVLGSGRGCDIRLKGLRRRHVTFAYVPGKGILLSPCHHRSSVWLDGVPLRRRAYALHGALLRAGGYTLCIRLFAGLDVPQLAMYQEHGQPAYEEDYYAPDDTQMAPVRTPYGTYWQSQEPEAAEVPLFDMTPRGPEGPSPAEQPRPKAPQAPEAQETPPAFTDVPDAFLSPEPQAEETEAAFTGQPPEYPAEAQRRHRRSERRRQL